MSPICKGESVPHERVLITGISGSGGSCLAEYILKNHPAVEVHGFSRWHSVKRVADPRIRMQEVDLMDLSSILRGMGRAKPDAIIHLASHANVRAGFDTPIAVLRNNVIGTANLMEAVRLTGGKPVFVMCSTSEVYGLVDPENVPITELCPVQPVSPYAVSKLAQDALAHTYFLNYGIPVIRTRMFSYFNPFRPDLFATNFADQVVAIERGKREELLHGNLASVRTMMDIRDACSAYWASLDCVPGEVYNIGGDITMSVGQFLDILKTYAKVLVKSRVDPALLRPTDVTLQIPDSTKFKTRTGWTPKYDLGQCVQYLLDHCRGRA